MCNDLDLRKKSAVKLRKAAAILLRKDATKPIPGVTGGIVEVIDVIASVFLVVMVVGEMVG